MKNLVIIQKLSHGARFIQLPEKFKVDISINKEVARVNFIDEQNYLIVHSTVVFIGNDPERTLDRFTEKGQMLIHERLSDAIISDIAAFMSRNYSNEENPGVTNHQISGCFDIVAYNEDWHGYYRVVTSDYNDILDEYIDTEEKGGKKK